MAQKKESLLEENIKSIIAIMWSLFSFVIMIIMLLKWATADVSIQTQIITGVFGITTLLLSYYYVSNKKEKEDKPSIEVGKSDTTNISSP